MPGFSCDDLGRDRAERDVGHGDDHHVGIGDGGWGSATTAGVAGRCCPAGELSLVHSGVLRCRLSDTRMPILPPAPRQRWSIGRWKGVVGHACLLLRLVKIVEGPLVFGVGVVRLSLARAANARSSWPSGPLD